MNYQGKVKLFQLASGQPVSDKRRKLTKEEFDFRDNLLREEIRELREAIVDNNRVEILDALCDIIYVSLGTCNTIGINHNFIDEDFDLYSDEGIYYYFEELDRYSSICKKCNDFCPSSIVTVCYELSTYFGFTKENFLTALDRVHESNMSKFCNDTKTAELTQEFYKKQGIDTYLHPREKKTIVYRKGDGKVLKSVNYHPVYLDDLV